MPGLHRPACPVVPAHGRAVVGRLRALAAHLVEAPALAVAFVAPVLHVAAGVVMGPALALVVNELSVGEERPVVLVQRRQFAERQVVHQHRGRVRGIVRAAAQVHHRHRARPLRGRQRRWDSAAPPPDRRPRRTPPRRWWPSPPRTQRARCRGPSARQSCSKRHRPPSEWSPRPRPGTCPVLLHHAVEHCLGLLARPGHDGLVILPRQQLKHNLGHRRVPRPEHRLGVPRAVLKLQPHKDRPLPCLERRHHLAENTGPAEPASPPSRCRISETAAVSPRGSGAHRAVSRTGRALFHLLASSAGGRLRPARFRSAGFAGTRPIPSKPEPRRNFGTRPARICLRLCAKAPVCPPAARPLAHRRQFLPSSKFRERQCAPAPSDAKAQRLGQTTHWVPRAPTQLRAPQVALRSACG